MLESYHEEIIHKKRAARIFWVIVFAFAGLLYFFFQGYYPDVQFRLANIGSGMVSGEERRLSIKSFGIVNIKTIPENLDLRLNDAPYGNNEKKMVSHGDYTFTVSGEGYLPGKMEFNIDTERPYYIDILNIIPKPSYLPYAKRPDQVAKIGDNSWITQDASGMTLFEGGFSTGLVISSKRFAHIGEGYFLSGNTIISYDISEHTWTLEKDTEWGMLAKRCSSITVKNTLLFCPKTGEAIFPSGKTLTGVLDIGNNYLTTKTSLVTIENNRVKKILSLSGVINDASNFISIEDTWYFSQNGELLPIGTGSRILTPLESIKYMEWTDGELLLFGSRGKDTFLSFFDVNTPEKSRTIPFPDISLGAIKIWKTAGNLFIKTEGALLFIYHGSDEIHWIIDGSIMTTGDEIAIYEKDGKVWKASWKEPIQ